LGEKVHVMTKSRIMEKRGDEAVSHSAKLPAGLQRDTNVTQMRPIPEMKMAVGTLFHSDWWLDAASGGTYDRVEYKRDGILLGTLPFVVSRELGFRRIGVPNYTRTLGPQLFLPPSKPFKRLQNIRHVVAGLVKALPRYDSLRMMLDPDDLTPFGFQMAGFGVEQGFTFRISPEEVIADVWRDSDQKTRNLIRTAERRLEVVQEASLATYIHLSIIERADDGENRHDFETMERIFQACLDRGQGVVLVARDDDCPVAAAVLVWGDRTLYFWQSARDREAGHGGANALLVWRALELAHSKGLIMDFDSYGSEGSARLLASFGRPAVARPEIVRQGYAYRTVKLSNQMVKDGLGRVRARMRR